MEFNKHRSMLKCMSEITGSSPLDVIKSCVKNSYGNELKTAISMELVWDHARRPYYNVWPTIIPILSKMTLNFSCSLANLPLPVLSVRFPTDHKIKEILCGQRGDSAIAIMVDTGRIVSGSPAPEFLSFSKSKEGTIQGHLDDMVRDGIPNVDADGRTIRRSAPSEGFMEAIKICLCLGMIDENRLLIAPDVLARDEAARRQALLDGDEAKLQLIEQRAFRRRGPGWDVGKEYECKEHGAYVVPPNPQLYWTGHGRAVPRIVVRSGYVVDKLKLLEVPTGYEADEQGTE